MWTQVCTLICFACVSLILPSSFSMGGLVAADTLIGMVNSRPDKQAPLWPKIVACIALDTPVSMFYQDPEPRDLKYCI